MHQQTDEFLERTPCWPTERKAMCENPWPTAPLAPVSPYLQFPLMIYCANTSNQMKECADWGFTVAFAGPYPKQERHGLPIVMRYTEGLDESTWLANFIMDKPDYYHERDGTLKYPPEWVQAEVEKGKREYPRVPTIVFLSGLVADDLTRAYIQTDVDIIALDWCQREVHRPISLLPDVVDHMQDMIRESGRVRPLWVILQVCASNMAASTPEENRAMTYMSLVHGAQGLGWWAYQYATHYDATGNGIHAFVKDIHPALWTSIRRMCSEVKSMTPAILTGQPVQVQRAGTVAYREIADVSFHWLLAVEEHGVAQWPEMTVHVETERLGEWEARVLTEARNVDIYDTKYGFRIRDGFKPFEAHSYCVRLRQPGEVLPPVPMLGRGGYF